jgi:hypothetical protein
MVELSNQDLMNIDGGMDFITVATEVLQTGEDVVKTAGEVYALYEGASAIWGMLSLL